MQYYQKTVKYSHAPFEISFSVHVDLQTKLTIPHASHFAKCTANHVAHSVCYLTHKFEPVNYNQVTK